PISARSFGHSSRKMSMSSPSSSRLPSSASSACCQSIKGGCPGLESITNSLSSGATRGSFAPVRPDAASSLLPRSICIILTGRAGDGKRRIANSTWVLAMSWNRLVGHDEIADRFRRALAEGRFAHTFLFVGPEGIGKRSFALALARALLCQQRAAELLDPCGQCPSCVQALAGTNPDLILVGRPAGKSDIPVGVLKGDDTYPVEQSLLFNLGLRPFYGGRKVAILDDADFLNITGANCLLKTLEEPPPASLLVLISTSAEKQLPTIRSRAQLVRFRPLTEEQVAKLLVGRQTVSD